MVKKNVLAYCVTAMMFLSAFIYAATHFRTGAREYPMAVSGMAVVMCLALIAQELWNHARRDGQAAQKFEQDERKKSFTKKEIRSFVISTVMILVYLFLIPRLGYITSTFLIMLSFLIILKREGYMLYVVLTVALCLVIHFVFGGLLNIFLPRGMFI
jgi:hypothetical protein